MNKEGDRYERLELIIYATAWAVAFCFPFLLQAYETATGFKQYFDWNHALRNLLFVWLPLFILFLINNFILLPKLFIKHRKTLYFLAVTALLVALWFVIEPPYRPPGPNTSMPRPPFNMFKISNIVLALCILSANMAIKLYVNFIRREAVLMTVKNAQMHSELESLRYRLNPHFLMNTLNNIQALVGISEEKTVNTISQLSRMLRYVLYETDEETVSLKKEVEFLDNFINLMRIRYADNVKISFSCHIDKDVKVPPLLFITFVENAFKHGVSYREECFIAIEITETEESIHFQCLNSKPANRKKGVTTGIGLENVRRRLALLYPGSHRLDIEDNEHNYCVNLILLINK